MFIKIKVLIITIIFTLLSFSLFGCATKNNNEANLEKAEYSRINYTKQEPIKEEKEVEISTFSTPLTKGAAGRITNIKLTSNKLNGYVLKNNETFSFNEIVGPCTAEEGYEKAEIFVNKKIKYAYGGGNCQVSTTLYNAVLAIPGITIVERHEHGRNVDYIEDGKDASVSYNTVDLKFKNETGNDLKFYVSCDNSNVNAKICKIIYK